MDPLDLGPLEEDFATLQADLDRIAAIPHSLGNAASTALDQIIAEGRADTGRPDSAVGHAFQEALYRVMRESSVTDMHGNLGFNIDKRSIAVHGAPVFAEVVGVVQSQVQSFLDDLTQNVVAAPPTTAAPTTAAPTPDAPAPTDADRPQVKLKVDLMSLFAGLIQNATEQLAKKR